MGLRWRIERCTLLLVLLFTPSVIAIVCPDETWREMNGKCYSKRQRGTHAECTAICGANASLVRITSRVENDFIAWVARGEIVWIGYYKVIDPTAPRDPGIWGRWTSSDAIEESAFTNWILNSPADFCGASNCAHMLSNGAWADVSCNWEGGQLRAREQPVCLCEYPTMTTIKYMDAVPLIEEDCDEDGADQAIYRIAAFLCVIIVELVHHWLRNCTRQNSTSRRPPAVTASEHTTIEISIAPQLENSATQDIDDEHEHKPLAGDPNSAFKGRRQSRIAELQHLKFLDETVNHTTEDVLHSLQINRFGVALALAGIRVRVPSCVNGPRTEKIVPAVSRVITTWYLLAAAEFNWNSGGAIRELLAILFFFAVFAFWVVHTTMVSVFVEDPAHLLFVIAPLRCHAVAWESLRDKLNATVPLCVACIVALSVGAISRVNVVVCFLAILVLFNTMFFISVTCLRLLSAGHVQLLVDLEQRICSLLRDTPESDKHTFCVAADKAESRVAGAMGVSNARMLHAIWIMLVNAGLLSLTALLIIKFAIVGDVSSTVVQLVVFPFCGMLTFGVWSLRALLNVLRSVGDALDDLVEEMLKVRTLTHASKFFDDPACLALRFGDRRTARKLSWVLLSDPVTSATTYSALGGVLLSSGFVFLPGLLGAYS